MSQGEDVGGIIGVVNSNAVVNNCCNTGTITGNSDNVGGIVGLVAHSNNVTNSTVINCYNSGEINGVTFVGGIVGLVGGSQGQGTVIQCYNKGKITGTTKIGETIGHQTNTTGLNKLNKLFYLNGINDSLTAIGNGTDDTTNKIMGIDDDMAYEQFKTWIETQ